MTKAIRYILRAFCTLPENKSIRWSLMWLLIPIHSDHLDPMMHSFIKRDDIFQADTEPISSSLLNNRAIMLPTCQGLMYNNMWSLPCTSEILEQCPNNWLLCRNQISLHTGSEIRIDLSLLNLGGQILSDILQTQVFFSKMCMRVLLLFWPHLKRTRLKESTFIRVHLLDESIEQGNTFLRPTQVNREIPPHGETCGNAVFNDPSILSCPFHMVPMNYVSAVIYGALCSTPFFSLNVDSCMDFSQETNWEKQNCSI